jgi:hypothetical protein
VSAENGIGTAGRLHAVEEGPETLTGQRATWPKGARIPFPRIKKDPKPADFGRNWTTFMSTLGEIGGIAAISAGAGWYSPGIGLISAGIGIFAISFVAGIPNVGPEQR